MVTIQDRGPYVPGRIVDLSPSTAQKIGITDSKGVAPVEGEAAGGATAKGCGLQVVSAYTALMRRASKIATAQFWR